MSVKPSSQGATVVVAVPTKLERAYARVAARCEQVRAEWEEHCEEYQARVARGAPVKRLRAQQPRLRARYDVAEERRQALWVQLPPPRPATNDDF